MLYKDFNCSPAPEDQSTAHFFEHRRRLRSGAMGHWCCVALVAVLAGCAGGDQRLIRNAHDISLLGSDGTSASTGRPSTSSLPPLTRPYDERRRPEYVEYGSGRFVGDGSQKQVRSNDGGRTVSLNFVDVDVQEFVRVVFDEVLKENVMLDPTLKGRITLRTSAPVNRAVAIDLVRQALQIQNASLVQADNTYRVTARADHRGSRRIGDSIRIVPLNYIGADEAKAALASFTQGGVEVSGSAAGRFLSISGPPADLDNLEQVISTLDIDQVKGMSIALLPLREANATQVASELNQTFGRSGDSRAFRTLPITRMNAVLVLATQPAVLAAARKWMGRLDRADRDGRRIYVYPVQNRRATDVARLIAGIIGDTRHSTTDMNAPASVAPQLTPVSNGTNPRGIMPPEMTAPQVNSEPLLQDQSFRSHSGRTQGPRVSADQSTNSVVVVASVEEWRTIESALRRLDTMPPQVLIEATIAEVRLTDSLRHGVRWYFSKGAHSAILTDSGMGSVDPVFPGFNYVFGTTGARVVLNALEEQTNVEIISAPALTVLDNQTAKLQVGDQVPIATRSSKSVITPDSPVVNDIEMKDTGVILSVTPRVNASGLVVLDITQEVSDVVPTTTSNLNSPTIRQRRVNSSVAVPSGTEIVLGGLMSVNRTRVDSGIPFVKDIPVVGNAFKSSGVLEGGRTELLVLLRPTVMGSGRDIQNITREIKQRMSTFSNQGRR